MQQISLKTIALIIYDFDGVMTDNRVLTFQDGREAVLCHRGDGLAIEIIKKKKIPQLIISSENNSVVSARAQKLNLSVIQGLDISAKKKTVIKYCKKYNIPLEKVLYVGNDLNDLEIMRLVGYPVAPADAIKKIKQIAKIITNANGGEGVIRELLNYLS